MKKTLVIIILTLLSSAAYCQANRHMLREGNRNYKKDKFDQAEMSYRRALESDSNDFRGQYNLGNALYRQKKYDEAQKLIDRGLSRGVRTDYMLEDKRGRWHLKELQKKLDKKHPRQAK